MLSSYLITYAGLALVIVSVLIFKNTVINISFLWIVVLLGCIAGFFAFGYFWKKPEYSFWSKGAYGMLTGGSLIAFLTLAPNYLLEESQFEVRQFDIVKSGTRSSRSRSCRVPYAIISIGKVEKEVSFSCDYERTIGDYRKIELSLTKGILGFYIIQSKRLIR